VFRPNYVVPAWLVTTLIVILVFDEITARTAASVPAPLGVVAALVVGAAIAFTFTRIITNLYYRSG